MNALVLLVAALESFGWRYDQDILKLQAEEEEPEKYVIYNIEEERPVHFADDVPCDEETSVQVHMYLPEDMDYRKDRKQLKQLLVDSGFSYPSVSLNLTESETGKRHICLETNICTESEV